MECEGAFDSDKRKMKETRFELGRWNPEPKFSTVIALILLNRKKIVANLPLLFRRPGPSHLVSLALA